MSKKLKIILVMSLCLNLLFIGALVGHAKYFKNVARNDLSIMKDFRETHKELREEIKVERVKALELISQESFDMKQYVKQVNKICKLQEKMFKEFSIAAAEKLREMPKEERDEMIKKMMKKKKKKKTIEE